MGSAHIDTERQRIHEEAERYRVAREKALQRYAADVQRMRDWLDDPARASEMPSTEIQKIRAEVDRAEREVYEAADRTSAEINAGIEQALSQLAEAERAPGTRS